MRFRVDSGDKELEGHLKTAFTRTTYISPGIQNSLIECCRLEILDTATLASA